MEINGLYSTFNGSPHLDTTIAQYCERMPDDRFSYDLHRSIELPFNDVLNLVRKSYNDLAKVRCFDARNAIVTTIDETAFTVIRDSRHYRDGAWDEAHRTIHITAYCNDLATGKCAYQYLMEHLPESKKPSVSWEYMVAKERKSTSVLIDKPKLIHNEFYPWIGDVADYLQRYMDSESPVLLLLGEPGTAKTSLIRSLIWKYSLNTMFTYEEQLLTSDAMFADFIAGSTNLLVIEDADVFLKSRQHDGNKIMSKFLNIGDGLASNAKKKIIFTANIVDASQVDSALIRPGRSFDCSMFRRLNYQEACNAAEVAGIPLPTDDRSYTLAELFALTKTDPIKPVKQSRVGFHFK